MNQEKIIAIVTKSIPYKENDKMVRLLSSDGTVVKAQMKGVKKPNAKLKFGALVFAFCEYQITTNKSGYHTVTGCSAIEDLFSITQDMDKFIYGTLILEAADIAAVHSPEPKVFIFVLKALKDILYSDTKPHETAESFFANLLSLLGFFDKTGNTVCPLKKLINLFEEEFSQKLNSAKLLTY